MLPNDSPLSPRLQRQRWFRRPKLDSHGSSGSSGSISTANTSRDSPPTDVRSLVRSWSSEEVSKHHATNCLNALELLSSSNAPSSTKQLTPPSQNYPRLYQPHTHHHHYHQHNPYSKLNAANSLSSDEKSKQSRSASHACTSSSSSSHIALPHHHSESRCDTIRSPNTNVFENDYVPFSIHCRRSRHDSRINYMNDSLRLGKLRRWSITSSGYSSQYSSQEFLSPWLSILQHQQQHEDRKNRSESPPAAAQPPPPASSSAAAAAQHRSSTASSQYHNPSRTLSHTTSMASGSSGTATPPPSAPITSKCASFNTNTSPTINRCSPTRFRRTRSRSLSPTTISPMQLLSLEQEEVICMNHVYKERFPHAKTQMEECLRTFIEEELISDPTTDSDSIARFVHKQLVEIAQDIQIRAEQDNLSAVYFYDITQNIERLLNEAREKSPAASLYLSGVAHQLLMIISRPARLLECLEFDPTEFYFMLEAAEDEAKRNLSAHQDIPKYIISKLGFHRDPLKELSEELSACSHSRSDTPNSLKSVHGSCSATKVGWTKKSSLVEDEDEDSCNSKFQGKLPGTNNDGVKPPREDDFDIVKLISNGAYGAVYLVRHKESRLRFAMKRINKMNLVLRNQVEQVFAERDILSFSDNPFVVGMYCSFEAKRHLCIVMEYVEGGDCATLLKSLGPFPMDMARLYFAETVLALEYLHSYGIVHRDLKPDNLLITSLGHIKLTDFGLSKVGLMSLTTNLLERDTAQFRDQQVFGTPEYIAPEVILRQGYGKPVDWWASGIILYEFLIGCVPFDGDTVEDLFLEIVHGSVEWPVESEWCPPEEAIDLVTRLLHKLPHERLGTIGHAAEVQEHRFFAGIDWDSLLRTKAEFIPQLEGEEDTSYFDSRSERYPREGLEALDDELDDSEDSSLFSSFSCCSPRYSLVYSGNDSDLEEVRRRELQRQAAVDSSHYGMRSQGSEDSSTAGNFKTENELSSTDDVPTTGSSGSGSLYRQNGFSFAEGTEPTNSLSIKEPLNTIRPNISKTTPSSNELTSSLRSLSELQSASSGLNRALSAESAIGERESLFGNTLSADDPLVLSFHRRKSVNSRRNSRHRLEFSRSASSGAETCGINVTQNECDTKDSGNVAWASSLPTVEITFNGSPEDETNPIVKPTPRRSLASLHPNRDRTPVRRSSGSMTTVYNSSSVGTGSNLLSCGDRQVKSAQKMMSPQKRRHHHVGAYSVGKGMSSANPSLVARRNAKRSTSTPLTLHLPKGDEFIQQPLCVSPGASSTSSRDVSPSRDLSPIQAFLKPPIYISRGAKGYGFTLKVVPVYFGNSDYYTLQHIVESIEDKSAACEAGLRKGDLLTHVNGEKVSGLTAPQVLTLISNGDEMLSVRCVPIEQTSIRAGGRKRYPMQGKMARRSSSRMHKNSFKGFGADKRRTRPSLVRKLSKKHVNEHVSSKHYHPVLAEDETLKTTLTESISDSSVARYLHQPAAPPPTPEPFSASSSGSSIDHSKRTPNSKSFNTLVRTSSSPEPRGCIFGSTLRTAGLYHQLSSPSRLGTMGAIMSGASSVSSSASQSTSNRTLPSSIARLCTRPNVSRPSSLHGLKQKPITPPTFHSLRSRRRKSVGHLPVVSSPLARTPSPGPVSGSQGSPSRSPSPLHLLQSSSDSLPGITLTSTAASSSASSNRKNAYTVKKSGSKSLLRRALSPDRRNVKASCAVLSANPASSVLPVDISEGLGHTNNNNNLSLTTATQYPFASVRSPTAQRKFGIASTCVTRQSGLSVASAGEAAGATTALSPLVTSPCVETCDSQQASAPTRKKNSGLSVDFSTTSHLS